MFQQPDQLTAKTTLQTQRRRLLFKLLAVLLSLLPLAAVEVVCRMMEWGRQSLSHDPFVGFGSVRPLFVLNNDKSRYEIPRSRQDFFRPDSFAAQKPDNEYRVFCLGGSTVQGNPYMTQTSFTTWLELGLGAAEPSRSFDVVNCGGISYASYRLTPILDEVLQYEPDLIILYTGQNEFLEDRSLSHIQSRGRVVNALIAGAARLRLFNLLQEATRPLVSDDDRLDAQRTLLPIEADARLDHLGGLAEYHRDVEWERGVIAQYCFNLLRMIEMARQAHVRILLINPVSNWRDQPPFKAEHREDLTAAEREEWSRLCEAGRAHLRSGTYELHKAAEYFESACELDALHAGGWFNLAKCYDALGRKEEAKHAYLKAKDLDVCPLRILESMNQAVLRIAAETSTPLVDAQKLFEKLSADHIVGGEWLVDHVHPSIEGHQVLANAILDKLVELNLVSQQMGFKERRDRRFQANLDSLDALYFLKGERHLENLRYWTKGEVDDRRLQSQWRQRPVTSKPAKAP